MKKSFAARRVPRKVGSDDDEGNENRSSTAQELSKSSHHNYKWSDLTFAIQSETQADRNALPGSSVKRPTIKPKRSSQVHRFSAASEDDNDDTSSGVITPKRSNLSRIALQRSAGQRSSFLANELPQTPADTDDDAPTYSAADLQQLRNNTPSTPRPDEIQATDQGQQALDMRDKFGTSLAMYERQQNSAIPSAAVIAEKKARRARLALESKADEYISLDPDDPGWEEDDDGNVVRDAVGTLVLREKDKYKIQESRLVRDDEDIMEGFDEYTGDTGSKISMGASSQRDDRQARRQDIAAQIARVEDEEDLDESDPDEKMRNAVFEAAQTKRAMYADEAIREEDRYAEYRAKTPPIITPLPDLESVLKRMRASLTEMKDKKHIKEAEMEQLTKEKFRIRDDEARVQSQLQEVAEKFRLLKIEKGFLPQDTLSNAAAAPASLTTERMETAMDDDNADEYEERPSLGLGAR